MPKVDKDYSLYRTYVIFRTLGLRHLVVVNVHNHVVGIITRKDLLPFMMQERLETLLDQTTSAPGADGKFKANYDVQRKSADSVDDEKSPNSAPLPSVDRKSSSNKTTLDGLDERDETDCTTSSADETVVRDPLLKDGAAAVHIVVSTPPRSSKQDWV